ncbi:MAG: ROK family protein [Fuerstiella sp.]|nr:ROK family protein [Fuerstiella sp.]
MKCDAEQNADRVTKSAIGLDVGGTKTTGAIVTAEGQIVMHQTIPTLPQRGGEAVAQDVYDLAKQLHDSSDVASSKPTGIGVSLCELVSNSGEIVSDATIKWRQIDIRRRLSSLAPTTIEADSRAAALCEAQYGAGRQFPIFLYVTIGTGISCSLVVDGRPFLGARGATGTMASGQLTTLCSQCGMCSTSIIEQIASGPAIAMRYNQKSGASAEGSEEVLAAADTGDSAARETVISGAKYVGSTVAQLVSVLDPHAVIVGGGLGSATGLYWQTLQESIRQHIWSDAHRQLPIIQGEYGNRAGVVGAAAAVLHPRVFQEVFEAG